MVKNIKADCYNFFACVAIIASLVATTINAEVRVILTAALTDNCFEFRKNQYIESLTILAGYGYKNPYIVEAIKKTGPTFLDDYSTNVFYATCNNPSIRNHGANEARSLLEALEHFQFADDDIIFKMTGRYQLTSDYLLKILEENKNNFDVFILVPPTGGIYCLAFAMRCKYLKEMLLALNYPRMEHPTNWITFEGEMEHYFKRKIHDENFNIFYLNKLDIRANLFGSSTVPGHPEEIRFY
jgi:hypothetical protein